jgi:hypothetical protein
MLHMRISTWFHVKQMKKLYCERVCTSPAHEKKPFFLIIIKRIERLELRAKMVWMANILIQALMLRFIGYGSVARLLTDR